MLVDVIEYRLPNRQRFDHQLEVDDACAPMYKALTDCGGHLTCERLTTSEVSITIEFDEGDFGAVLTSGQSMEADQIELELMIKRFNTDVCKKWQKVMRERNDS